MAGMDDMDLSPVNEASRLILLAGRAMDALGRSNFSPYGLTISDVAPLTILDQLGPLTPTQLLASSPLFTSSQVVSHSLNRLEKAGFITRKKATTDGRSVNVAVTERGRAMSGELLDVIGAFSADFLSPLSNDEVLVLCDLLGRCVD
jgi:DNA-binding MarR family transcriptional regulator